MANINDIHEDTVSFRQNYYTEHSVTKFKNLIQEICLLFSCYFYVWFIKAVLVVLYYKRSRGIKLVKGC